jgi:PKD repeat protein
VTISVGTPGSATASGQRWEFTANVTGGGEGGTGNATIRTYAWSFGDGSSVTTSGNVIAHVYDTGAEPARRTVRVTVTAQDGRTASGETDIIVAARP